MRTPKPTSSPAILPPDERRRRKREIIIIFVVIVLVSLMTVAENRVIHFGSGFPISNTILMFILININLLLLLLLIFLVFRNLVKLLYDRRRKVMGSKLRTKLALAFIALTLLPTTILFFFSINFITTSIEFWFNVPVEQALEKSLGVGRSVYRQAEESHRFFIERIAYQIRTKKLLDPQKKQCPSPLHSGRPACVQHRCHRDLCHKRQPPDRLHRIGTRTVRAEIRFRRQSAERTVPCRIPLLFRNHHRRRTGANRGGPAIRNRPHRTQGLCCFVDADPTGFV